MFTDLIEMRLNALGTLYEWIPDGVYIGLPEELYFGQEAIGSSDLIRLWKHKHGWWWQSKWNPDRVEKKSIDRLFGQAAHAVILEGLDVYRNRFAVLPEKLPGAITTMAEAIAALRATGRFSFGGTSSWKADDWFEACRIQLPTVECWPNTLADFHASNPDRPVITSVQDRMLRIMHTAAMANRDINKLFGTGSGFPPLAEVSVLKTLADGTRRRWRMDRLFPSFTLDLKTLGNWEGRPLKHAVGDHIGRGGYDIQRADYDAGRTALNLFVCNGFKVYGGTPEQRHFLLRIGESTTPWDWVWLFYQKPEPTGRAPVLFPVMDEADSSLQRTGAAKAANALTFYRQMMVEFGPTEPWTHVDELHFTDPARIPAITLPHWIGEEDPPADSEAWDSSKEQAA